MGYRITPDEYERWERLGLIPSVPLAVAIPPSKISRPAKVPLPPKMTEAQFQRHVIHYAQACGWRVAHFRAVRVQRSNGKTYHETPVAADGRGFPDLILVRGRRLIAIELKAGKNKPTPEQRQWLDALEQAWVPSYVYYPEDWQEIMDLLD